MPAGISSDFGNSYGNTAQIPPDGFVRYCPISARMGEWVCACFFVNFFSCAVFEKLVWYDGGVVRGGGYFVESFA